MGELDQIKNFIQLTPMVGTAGQPSAEQFTDIANAGFKTVINLAMPDSENALAQEGSLVTSAGMQYVHLPIDFAAPTGLDARHFIALMNALDDDRIFVHCALNLRVSAFMYLYLRYAKGCTDEEARSPLIEKWWPRMDQVWKYFLALSADDIAAS